MKPDPAQRLDVATKLAAGMLANPALTSTSPGPQFLLQEALDLTDRLLLECSTAPKRRGPDVVQGEIVE